MFVMEEETTACGYEVHEGCYGTVVGRCRKGAYLTLDNGETAFAYEFANLWNGTKVLCTVRRLANGDRLKLVSIDSVVHYPAVA